MWPNPQFLCGASKGFMKALKAFINPFEVPQRNCGFGSHPLKKSLMENFIYCAVSDYLCSQKKCRKCIFQWSGGDLNFRKPHGDNELSNRQTVKKLNLWGKNGCR